MTYRKAIDRLKIIIPVLVVFLFQIDSYANAQDGTLKWRIDFGYLNSLSGPAIGPDRTVYVHAANSWWEGDPYLFAINPDGTEKWRFGLDGYQPRPPSVGTGGTIYVSDFDRFFAINPDGTQKWAFDGRARSIAIAADGTIYTGTDKLYAKLYAINPDGTQKWAFDGRTRSIAIAADGTIYAADDDKLYAVNPDGTQKWALPVPGIGDPTAIASDGTIYAGSLHAINPDGTQKWALSGVGEAQAIGADGTIYTGDGLPLYAINPDGTEKWMFDIGNQSGAPAIGSNGIIYIGFHAINSDGTLKWEFPVDCDSNSSTTIGADGTLYTACGATLYAINSNSKGLANSSWPMFKHDERHTGRATKPAKDLAYTPVTPCRIVDTRKSGGIIGASTQRNFHVFGSGDALSAQGGNSAGCSSPMGEPLAAHINMVAVNPTGKGNLQAFPVGAGTGAGLSVNYNAIDTNLANAGTVKTVTGSGPDITVASNFSSTHTVIDVLGYYYIDEGFYYNPVDPCRIVDTRKTSAGKIDANTQRNFDVFGSVGDQGGNPAGCPSTLGVPPRAAHLNMVAVDPAGKGNLQAFPVGAVAGAGLSVNYNTIDTNLANAGTVKTSPDITVASNFSTAHTVIDVLGYYSEEEDLLYTPVIPCRIVDTRKTTAGIIDANTQRNFRVFGPVSVQGGNSSGCSAPMGEPLAAHINMVAVNPTGKGNLQAFPVGAGTGAGLSVNYNAIDTNLANAGTVKTVTGSGPDITVASNFSSAHTVIDVLGYYYQAP